MLNKIPEHLRAISWTGQPNH